MGRSKWTAVIMGSVFSAALAATAKPEDDAKTSQAMEQSQSAAMATVDRASVDKIVAGWPERPRLGANGMMAKYGAPHEATSERLIWHNAGPFKRVMVIRAEAPHDFPLPHMDFLEHTITYNVPQDKVGDLIAFDASSTINRTVGELSARCDLEGHNILTLNLDHDIVTGKKTVEEARKAFGEIVAQDVMGKHPSYVEALQFEPHKMSAAAFTDEPVIPGSPVRPSEPETKSAGSEVKSADSQVLASVIAVDLNEVLAAAEAKKKKVSQPVLDYAKMLHEEHGMHMVQTMKLGQKIDVRPLNTLEVEKLQKKGAGELAALVLLDGPQFEQAYIAAKVKGHAEVLDMIDNQLLETVKNDELKMHVTKTREAIAAHLEKAKEIESGLKH